MTSNLIRPSAPLAIAFAAISMACKADAATLHVGVGQPYTTIQSALNSAAAGDEVVVHAGGYPEQINLIGKNLTLRSLEGSSRTFITSNSGVGPVVACTSAESSACVIEGFTISGAVGMGLMLTSSSPTIRDCAIQQNYSNGNNGGGVYFNGNGGNPTFTNCLFAGNRAASREGGAVFAEATNSSVTFTNCDFVSNEAGSGGAIRNTNTRIYVSNSRFRANVAGTDGDRSGGAITSNAQLTVTNSTFSDNQVAITSNGGRAARGGAIAAWGPIDISGTTFLRNQALVNPGCCGGTSTWGGAIYCASSSMTVISNCEFTGNASKTLDPDDGREARGGALIFLGGCDPVIRNCSFGSNSATAANSGYGAGGTMWYDGGSSGLLEDCNITQSTASTEGGAMFLNGGATPLVVRTNISLSSVSNLGGNGGAIRAQDGANAVLSECRISSAQATSGGGAYIRNSQVTFDHCVLDRNSATNGSAVCTEGFGISNVPTIKYSFFCGNSGTSTNWIQGGFNDVVTGSNTLSAECSTDCNDNGIYDHDEIASGAVPDCNSNDIPDSCDIASGSDPDCDGNRLPDSCDILGGRLKDCNGNGIPDPCELNSGAAADCNHNGKPDSCDIASGLSGDCNTNGVPDSCEPDCNGNGIPNACEIAAGAPDCNGNGVPDACDLAAGTLTDRNKDGTPDSCQRLEYLGLRSEFVPIAGTATDPYIPSTAVCMRIYAEFSDAGADLLGVYGNADNPLSIGVTGGGFFQALGGANTTNDLLCTPEVPSASFKYDSWLTIGRTCIDANALQVVGFGWGGFVTGNGFTDNDCIVFVTPGSPQAYAGPTKRVLLAQLTSRTGVVPTFRVNLVGRNSDGSDWNAYAQEAPAPALVDCNRNGIQDAFDVSYGGISDCNDNGVPDSCEFADFNNDCNNNGVPDRCDIYAGTSQDLDNTGIPDECECVGDVDRDGRVNVDDIVAVIIAWGDGATSPADLNGDGIVNAIDLALVLGGYGECR